MHAYLFVLATLLAPGDGPIVENSKLVPADNAFDDRFGSAVVVDGDRIAIGAPTGVSFGATGEGVYVYVRNGTSWVLEQKIPAPDPTGVVAFGAEIDLDGDLLVASSYRSLGGCSEERAFLFRRTAGQWVLEAPIDPPTGMCNDRFGSALALDGNSLVVGAREWGAPAETGAAFLYRLGTNGWDLQQGLLPAQLDVDDEFGSAVDKEGDIIVVGAPLDDDAGLHAGAVYVFQRTGPDWVEAAKLVADDVLTRYDFGAYLSLDSHRLAVAAPSNVSNYIPGWAYVFARTDSGWLQEARVTGSDSAVGDFFSYGLALAGNTLVAGARLKDGIGPSTGAAYVFQREGSSWIERQKLQAADGEAFDNFGLALGLDRGVIAIGAPFDDHAGADEAGSAYVFDNPLPSSYCATKPASSSCYPSVWASGTPSVSAPQPFDVRADQIVSQKNGLLFYGYGAAAVPFLGGTLCVAPPLRRTLPQSSAGNPPPFDCSGTLALDFNALIQGGTDPQLIAGAVVHAQYWFRDPSGNQQVGLTNGLRFEIAP